MLNELDHMLVNMFKEWLLTEKVFIKQCWTSIKAFKNDL